MIFRLSLSCRSRRRTRMGKRAARRMTVVAVPKASALRGSPMGQGTPRLRFGIASGETFPLRSEIRCALFKPSPKGEGGAAIRQVSSDAGRIIGAAGENRGLSTASASLRSAPSRQGEGGAHANCSRGEKASDTHRTAGAAGGTPPHTAKQKAPSPNRETVLFAVQKFRFHEPLPVEGTGAVTSVRVTPLEKVRLLRMVEKSLDMLR